MKTPQRHYELTATSHNPCERVWDLPQENVSAQRWKRKNRILQLKRTIARQAEEIEHYKNLLALSIIGEHYKLSQHCIDWAAKHIRVEMHQSRFEHDKTTQQLTVTIPAPDVLIDGRKYPTAQFIQNYAKP